MPGRRSVPLPTVSEWQPIDTAPQNGDHILAWDGEQHAVIAWSTRDQEWFLCDGQPAWEGVTHWRPLPAPPDPAQQSADL